MGGGRLIIGVAGVAGVGKTTAVAAHLVSHYRFERHGFADALKDEVRTLYRRTLLAYAFERGDPMNDLTVEVLLRDKPPLVRTLLQDHGMARRAEAEDYWIQRLAQRVTGLPRVVIDDARLMNEFCWITGTPQCGRLWRVIGPARRPVDATHVSETDQTRWERWDATLENTGTPEHLWDQIDAQMARWLT